MQEVIQKLFALHKNRIAEKHLTFLELHNIHEECFSTCINN